MARLSRLEGKLEKRNHRAHPELERLRTEPLWTLRSAGIEPDPWQAEFLQCDSKRILLCCSRQAGKSTVASARAIRTALLRSNATILILSPTERQSIELLDKIRWLYSELKKPIRLRHETQTKLVFSNGSRIIALPDSEKTIRCFSSVSLLLIDEASRVSDALYASVRPMLSVSKGDLIALSTPFGQRGFFFEEFQNGDDWKKVKVTAPECPRISTEFLASERKALGERWFRQEYMVNFEDTVDAVFSSSDIEAALSGDVQPLFEIFS